ncbi:helix-turn-helix domain-containing protein [Massilia sp. LjRoot122]|uniref:helix-turn-helix domain-containing protein n=1 Tax=Massilia sp. LjRoot122 TaxID=3342257 RepID=UPI003F4F7636
MDSLEKRRRDLVLQVKRVLAAAGVPASGYAKTLSTVLGVASAQAYRKLSGASVFTLPQIEAIETHFGVELLTVVPSSDGAFVKGISAWTDATLRVAGHALACKVQLGNARKGSTHRFAAYLLRGEWHVCLADDCSDIYPLFDVTSMDMVTTLGDE